MLGMIWRLSPRLLKLGVTYLALTQTVMNPLSRVECRSLWSNDKNTNLNKLLNNEIRLQWNGDVIGHAYCFAKNYLVTASPELFDNKKIDQKGSLQCYQGNHQIKGKVKIVANFENLSIIQIDDKTVQPIYTPTPTTTITPVQILQKKHFLSIKDGYYVAQESGFGIVDGKGHVGSLIVSQGSPLGIVTHVGRDREQGFMRLILWKDLPNLVRRLQQQPLYLGISATAMQDQTGVSVVRVATNSPLRTKMQMGDVITRVNNQEVRSPDDLARFMIRLAKAGRSVLRGFCSNQPAQTLQSTLLTDAQKQFDPIPVHLKPYDAVKYQVPLQNIKRNSGYALISIEPFPRARIMKIGYNLLQCLRKDIPEQSTFRILSQTRVQHIMSMTDRIQNIQELQENLGVQEIELFIQTFAMQFEVIDVVRKAKPWEQENKPKTTDKSMNYKPDPRYPIFKKGQNPTPNFNDI